MLLLRSSSSLNLMLLMNYFPLLFTDAVRVSRISSSTKQRDRGATDRQQVLCQTSYNYFQWDILFSHYSLSIYHTFYMSVLSAATCYSYLIFWYKLFIYFPLMWFHDDNLKGKKYLWWIIDPLMYIFKTPKLLCILQTFIVP